MLPAPLPGRAWRRESLRRIILRGLLRKTGWRRGVARRRLLHHGDCQLRPAVRATDDLPLMSFIDREDLLTRAADLNRHGQAGAKTNEKTTPRSDL